MSLQKRFGRVPAALSLTLVSMILSGCDVRKVKAEPSAGVRMTQAAYVWQREWDADVRQAVTLAAGNADAFIVLAAEATWVENQPVADMARVDYAFLKTVPKPVGIAIRIGDHAANFAADEKSVGFLQSLVSRSLADAESCGLHVVELQIDYDCAESRLEDYTFLVKAIRRKVQPLPMVITVLPCWLNNTHFPELARASDGFVLQVHSLESPGSPDTEMKLCDPAKARTWVEQAGKIGVPFRVALPTYGYLAAFSVDGKFVGVSAEGPAPSWDDRCRIASVRADPGAMAELANSWSRTRPLNMKGLIWYRLPVQGDRLNWKWDTLSTIISGKTPVRRLVLRVEYPDPPLAEVMLHNEGQIDVVPDDTVELEWDDQRLIGGDGLSGFELERTGNNRACLKYAENLPGDVLSAGEDRKIAWLRFDGKTKVRAHVGAP